MPLIPGVPEFQKCLHREWEPRHTTHFNRSFTDEETRSAPVVFAAWICSQKMIHVTRTSIIYLRTKLSESAHDSGNYVPQEP